MGLLKGLGSAYSKIKKGAKEQEEKETLKSKGEVLTDYSIQEADTVPIPGVGTFIAKVTLELERQDEKIRSHQKKMPRAIKAGVTRVSMRFKKKEIYENYKTNLNKKRDFISNTIKIYTENNFDIQGFFNEVNKFYRDNPSNVSSNIYKLIKNNEIKFIALKDIRNSLKNKIETLDTERIDYGYNKPQIIKKELNSIEQLNTTIVPTNTIENHKGSDTKRGVVANQENNNSNFFNDLARNVIYAAKDVANATTNGITEAINFRAINKINKQIATKQKSLAKFEKQIKIKFGNIDGPFISLKEKLNCASFIKEDLVDKLNVANTNYIALSTENNRLTEEVKAQKDEIDLCQQLNEQRKGLKENITQLNKDNELLNQQIDLLKADQKQLICSSDQKEFQHKSISNELKDKTDAINIMVENETILKKKITSLESQLKESEDIKKKNIELEKIVSENNITIKQLNVKFNQLKDQLGEFKKKSENEEFLTKRLIEVSKEKIELLEKINTLTEQITNLNEQITILNKGIEEMSKKILLKSNQPFDPLSNPIQKEVFVHTHEDFKKLTEKNLELRTKLESASEEITALNKKIEDLENNPEKSSEENNSLKSNSLKSNSSASDALSVYSLDSGNGSPQSPFPLSRLSSVRQSISSSTQAGATALSTKFSTFLNITNVSNKSSAPITVN